MDDRLAAAIPLAVGLLFGRALDPQWRRDWRWKLTRFVSGQKGESWEQRLREQVKRRMKKAA